MLIEFYRSIEDSIPYLLPGYVERDYRRQVPREIGRAMGMG